MRKIILQLFICATVFLIGCKGGSNDDSPKGVAKNFFEAFKTMNIDEAAKYATKESKGMLDLIKMGVTMQPQNIDSLKREMDKHSIEYSEPVINGDEADIVITTDGKEKTNFKLKKEDGLWKVAFDKNSLMKTGMEKMQEKGMSDEQLQELQNEINNINTDSLANALKEATEANKPE